MKQVRIDIIGCHDITSMLVSVNENELKFLDSLCQESKSKGGGCQPIMEYTITHEAKNEE